MNPWKRKRRCPKCGTVLQGNLQNYCSTCDAGVEKGVEEK